MLVAPSRKVHHNPRPVQLSANKNDIHAWASSTLPTAGKEKRRSRENPQNAIENGQESFSLIALTFTSRCVKAVIPHVRSALLPYNSSVNARPTCLTL